MSKLVIFGVNTGSLPYNKQMEVLKSVQESMTSAITNAGLRDKYAIVVIPSSCKGNIPIGHMDIIHIFE